MDLFCIVYRSRAKISEASVDEAHLLLDARASNRVHGITGYLHRNGDVFVQYFEGEEAPVRQLYENIKRDTRHGDVSLLAATAIAARRYSDWQLGFSNLTAAAASPFFGTPDDVLEFFGLDTADRHLAD